MRMTRIAPAKINLMLHVVGRLPDNFHHLQSIVTFTHSGDDIVIEKAPEFAITVTGTFAARIPPQQDNIIVKAIQWVNQRYNWNEFYHCHLTKNLPVASGMGGGSSDAAATIAAILHLHKVSLSLPEINALVLDSGMLGADVPLCLAHQLDQGSLLWIDSSGRETLPVPLKATLPGYIVLANPGVMISTPAIFKQIIPPYTATCPPLFPHDLLSYLKDQTNDLIIPAIKQVHIIHNIIELLGKQQNCRLARMTGSGATCFGLFDNPNDAEKARKNIQDFLPGKGWTHVCRINRPTSLQHETV